MTSHTSVSASFSDANMVATLAMQLGGSKVISEDKVQFTADIYAAHHEASDGSSGKWVFLKSHTGCESTRVEALLPLSGDLDAQQVLGLGKKAVLDYLTACVLKAQGGDTFKPQCFSTLPQPGIPTQNL